MLTIFFIICSLLHKDNLVNLYRFNPLLHNNNRSQLKGLQCNLDNNLHQIIKFCPDQDKKI